MRQKELLIISLTLFITICGWIISDILHINTKKTNIESDTQTLMEANKVSIKSEVFNELLLRK